MASKIGRWTYYGDVNRSEYGGTDMRHVGGRRWQFIELINMDEACGRENEGQPKYVVELSMVDLDAIPLASIDSALRSCGPVPDANGRIEDAAVAESCRSYGAAAPLDSFSGNNYRKLLREAYRAAAEYARDSAALAEAMERPVNAIGSTAAEFMRGDLDSAMIRGVEAGDPAARILAKMHGAPQDAIDDARPDDFLPYVFGYMAAMNGSPEDKGEDVAPEYHRGYQRGQRVKAGEAPAPSWIKEGK